MIILFLKKKVCFATSQKMSDSIIYTQIILLYAVLRTSYNYNYATIC